MQCSPPAFADVTFAQALCARRRGETLAKVAVSGRFALKLMAGLPGASILIRSA